MIHGTISDRTIDDLLTRLTVAGARTSTGACAAVVGSIVASILDDVFTARLEGSQAEKIEDELRDLRRQTRTLRRDLTALVEQASIAEESVANSAAGSTDDEESRLSRVKALMFAAEVPLRAAASCHALLGLSLRALKLAGVKAITQIGSSAALAYSGVVSGAVTARAYLAGIPEGTGVDGARKRAELILRDSEALRSQIIDRVRQHLP